VEAERRAYVFPLAVPPSFEKIEIWLIILNNTTIPFVVLQRKLPPYRDPQTSSMSQEKDRTMTAVDDVSYALKTKGTAGDRVFLLQSITLTLTFKLHLESPIPQKWSCRRLTLSSPNLQKISEALNPLGFITKRTYQHSIAIVTT
jgi:hypothetical protein